MIEKKQKIKTAKSQLKIVFITLRQNNSPDLAPKTMLVGVKQILSFTAPFNNFPGAELLRSLSVIFYRSEEFVLSDSFGRFPAFAGRQVH